MFSLITFLVGLILGVIIGIYIKKSNQDILTKEYISNTGKKSYRIYKIEKGLNESGLRNYEKYLGEVEG